MKRKRTLIAALLILALLLSACGKKEKPQGTEATGEESETAATVQVKDPDSLFTDRDARVDYDADTAGIITLKGDSAQSSTDAVKISGTTVEITEEGTYVLSGQLNDGQVLVNCEKSDKVQLVLNGANIASSTSAAIYVRQADKVFVTTREGTENTLENTGAFTEADDNNVDAALFSKDDLTLNGKGTLTVTSPAGHGVVSKDDLVITGGTYQVSSAAQGLSGKDSVRISDGVFTLTAGKDGIHAENSEDDTLGFCYISGGNFTVTAEGDGISASGTLEITDGNFAVTAGGGSENGDKQNSGNYGGFPGGMGGMGRPGGMGKPGRTVEQTTGETDESTSMKGLKAGDALTVLGGTFQMNTADDALHSNADVTVAGGTFTVATGDDGMHADNCLTVSGGTVTVTESYEGLEGQHIVVSGGEISVVASDDGLNAAGGTDNSGLGGRDQMPGKGGFGGMSAGNGSIVISGGTLYVQASGDGIDANGTLEITGGHTTVCGPTQGDTATLDYDKTAVISGGTFIGTGASGMAQSFSGSENQGVIALQVGSAPAGTEITIKDKEGNVILSCAPKLSYNVAIFSCPQMEKGQTYTVCMGDQSAEFEAN